MNRLLEENLSAIYPGFMSGGDDKFRCGRSCETGDGWFPLLASLLTALAALSKRRGAEFTALQIKEKFGALRVYFECASSDDLDVADIARLLVNLTEHLSASICEIPPDKKCLLSPRTRKSRCRQSLWPARLLEALRPKLDLALLPPLGRIELSTPSLEDACRLTLVRYRSIDSYAVARLSEICEVIAWYASYIEAREATKRFDCHRIEWRAMAKLGGK